MQVQFSQMNEDYINKHYPDRSVFSAVNKANKKVGIGVYVFFAILMAASGYGTVWGILTTMEDMKNGESDMLSVGIVIIGFCFVVFALSLFVIVLTIKRNNLGAEGLIKKSAKNSQCSESDIREFERQAMTSDSYILSLTGKIKAVLNGQKDGVMTKDYIYLSDAKNIVMKRSDIIGAFLVERSYYITVNNTRKLINYLTVTLVSDKGIQTLAETSFEAGEALLEMLREQNPQIDVNNGSVMTEKEYSKYCKAKFFNH